MSPKLPVKGTVASGIHTRPAPTADPDTPRPAITPHIDAGPSTTPTVRNPAEPGGPSVQLASQGVTPPQITIHQMPSAVAITPTPRQLELEHYWIAREIRLPAADAQGFRTYRKHRYVDVAGERIVHVVMDPDMRLYRAKRLNERLLGPVLVRDPESRLWHPLENATAIRPTGFINREMDALTASLNEVVRLTDDQRRIWLAMTGREGEKAELVKFELLSHKQLAALEKAVDFYIREQTSLLLYKGPYEYEQGMLLLQKRRVEVYCRVMVAGDIRKGIDIRAHEDRPLEAHRSMVGYLKGKLALLQKCRLIADDILQKSPHLQSELAEYGYDPGKIHGTTADWIYSKSRLLASGEDPGVSLYLDLSSSVSDSTRAFLDIESIPQEARIPVLSSLIEQCAATRETYAEMVYPIGPEHDSSRKEIADAVQAFENTLEKRIALDHQQMETTPALSAHDQPIDFDFIPAQVKNQPVSTPRKMFRAKHRGVYKISVGRPRRTASGEEVIDVMNPHEPTQVMHTYERREGEWRRQVAMQEKNLATLILQARQLLEQSESHLNTARYDEAAKRNATNIAEFLGDKAEALDDLCLQIERAPNPGTTDIDPVVQHLKHASGRFLSEGEEIRIRLYKDKSFLSASRVAYLIRQKHISVTKTHNRMERGKGKDKHFLDIYSLEDKRTGEPLWEAHFHYEKKTSDALNFTVKGGHLKTLQQSSQGASAQRRDEVAGRPHVPIWREIIDSRTAQSIFELAA